MAPSILPLPGRTSGHPSCSCTISATDSKTLKSHYVNCHQKEKPTVLKKSNEHLTATGAALDGKNVSPSITYHPRWLPLSRV